MTSASVIIPVIAVLIVAVIAWNVSGGKEDLGRHRRRRRRGTLE